jgi:hypothetical protein
MSPHLYRKRKGGPADVLNNPLSNIDPTGLDCVYLNDNGDAVEGIDHNSNPDECSGNNNGGYWIPGTVANSSWVTNIDQNSNQIGAFSQLDNGTLGWTGSNNQLGGGWGTVGIDVSTTAANNGGIWDDVKNWFHTAKLVGAGGSLWIAHPAFPVGWSPGANFVSDGKQIHGCASILAGGVGAKVPGYSVGLLFGDPSKAASIIQGLRVTINVNTPFYWPRRATYYIIFGYSRGTNTGNSGSLISSRLWSAMCTLVFSFVVLIAVSAAFLAVGLLIAFWPATYLRWVRWSNVEIYAPWVVRGLDVHSWRFRAGGILMALFGVIFAILTVYICWFQ